MDEWDDGNGVDVSDPWAGYTANSDGSFTDPGTGDIFNPDGSWVGIDNGDGTWTDGGGIVRNDADNSVYTPPGGSGGTPIDQDPTLTYDPQSGLYYDELLGIWWKVNEDGTVSRETELVPRYPPGQEPVTPDGGPPTDLITPTNTSNPVSDFFKKLFGGSTADSATQGALQSRADQAKQALTQAQQQGASTQQLAALQQALNLAQTALKSTQGFSMTTTILIAAGAGLGVYAFTRSRRQNPGRRRFSRRRSRR